MNTNTNTKAFFELLRAGLWEKEVRLSNYENIDFAEVVLPKDYVEWGKECDERGIIFLS